uniref:receptor protein-tyrosine kinase n=1 Tax=Parascaris univalens TaxID=6257 RepID=A0A914ZNN2_PARUN
MNFLRYIHRLNICAVLLLFLLIPPSILSKKVVLLDTSLSTTELRWKTYSNIEDDEIGWLEETYRGPEGVENRRAYVVCNVEHANVDNWLRTPRIERDGANRLHVEVTFTMRDCNEFPGNARSCKETFRLYAMQVSGTEVSNTWNETSWDFIGRIAADTGRHSKHESSAAAVNQEIRSYTVTKDAAYFAFRDSGACISILNVKIFYEVCPEATRSFVIFPQTITGPGAQSLIAVSGKCVANASPIEPTKLTYICKATGAWEMPTGECRCNAGYVGSAKRSTCAACTVGTYKANVEEDECRPCPAHSTSTSSASTECQCDSGYYRADGETVEYPCTQPPSKPSRLTAIRVDAASVMLEWDEPSMLGGRKELWYRYQCSTCPSTVHSIPSERTFSSRRLELTGLQAGTTYTVMVFAENKVSKLIPELSQYALVEFTTRSLSPIVIVDLRVEGVQENGVTLAWNPPTTVGMATQSSKQPVYEIESRHNGSVSVVETPHTYYTFDNLNSMFPYSFKVRALTAYGWGTWSEPLWYQPGRGQFLPPNSGGDGGYVTHEGGFREHHWAVSGPPLWVWILLICVLLLVVVFTLLVCSRKAKGNRKHFSDCDGLDPYKNGTLTPDYNTPPQQGLMHNLFHGKLGAPLISYGSQQSSACYGNTRFKPYVDPTAYEDPNQALSEFANNVDPALIRITEVIGSGEFGEVCKGVLQPTPRVGTFDMSQVQTVAIKTLKPGSSEKAKSDFLMEASIMGQFEHENVIRLIGVVTKSEPIMIITEFMENGSLDQFLRKHDDGLLRVTQIVDMLRGIAAGMKYLTEKGFIHRDLAARNVLVDSKLCCKIADFGLSRGLEGSVEQEYTTNGGKIPVRWTAPEAITHRKFTAASDVWSFGVVMWEVCSFGERPYWEWTNQKVISEITLGYRLPAPMDTPQSLHDLMMRCWHIDRHKRPTFAQILQTLEEYVKQPELIYAEESNEETFSGSLTAPYASLNVTGTIPRQSTPGVIPSPPTSNPPPIPLDDFLKRIALGHCAPKLHMAGVQTVAELMRLSHIDLLSYGLIAEEAQRIRDAFSRPMTTLQRTQNRSDQRLYRVTMQSLPQCRMASVPNAMSSAVQGNAGFFV